MKTKGKSREVSSYRGIKTAALMAAFFDLGICIAMLGPTLPTLAHNLGVETKSLSFIFTARGCGYLIGSILSSLMFRVMNPNLVVAINLTLTAFGNFGAPFMPNSILLAGLLLIAGVTMGILDAGGNVMCLELWGAKSESWMQALHFSFALGATLAPIVAQPFINDANIATVNETRLDDHQNTTHQTVHISESTTRSMESHLIDSIPQVAWSFIIAATCCLVMAIFYFILTFSKNPEMESRQEDTSKQEGLKFRLQILFLLFIFYFLYVGTEVTFGLFIYSFAINCERNYSKESGSLLNSLFWGVFAAGRFFAIFFSKCISPKGMLLLDLIGTAIAVVLMALFPLYANSSEWILWVAVGLYGWSMASLFPTGISWAERYITVTGSAASFLVVGAALGEMVLPFLMGHIIERNVMNLMYFCLISTGVSILNFWILDRIAKKRGSRLKRKNIDLAKEKKDQEHIEEYALLPTNETKANALDDSMLTSTDDDEVEFKNAK